MLLLCLTAASCSGSKNAAKEPDLSAGVATSSQNVPDSKEILDAVCVQYIPWHEVSLQGKISMDGLPLDPSVKIYMIRDKQLLISVRAPIVGEVARVEIADGELLLVNRMKKTYTRTSLDKLLSRLDMTLENIQDIFLGRVFVLGQGTLSSQTYDSVSAIKSQNKEILILPVKQSPIAAYGFTISPEYRLSSLFAETTDGVYNALANYKWQHDTDKKDIILTITAGDIVFKPIFSFQAPDFTPKPLERIKINPKWKEVSIKDLMQF